MSLDSKVKWASWVRLSRLEADMNKCKVPDLYILADMTMIWEEYKTHKFSEERTENSLINTLQLGLIFFWKKKLQTKISAVANSSKHSCDN